MFKDQLHNQLKLKRELTSLLSENEAKLHLLKANLSNLGVKFIILYMWLNFGNFLISFHFLFKVVSSIEKSRINTPSNLIEDYDLKKGFVELQSMRDEVLSFRPKGMFNPKYQRVRILILLSKIYAYFSYTLILIKLNSPLKIFVTLSIISF